VSSRRTAILIGAIAVGIVAVVLIWQYVRGIENNLYAESQPVSIFVAANTIPRGTAGEVAVADKSIVQGSIPQKYYPATAITSADEILKKVALFEISPGTPIVRGMFVDASTTQISFRERLANKNHVAITVQVDQVKGVGGFLVPGDEVNIMVIPASQSASQGGSGGGGVTSGSSTNGEIKLESSARMLYQKVKILAVGQSQLLSPGEQASAANGGAAGGGSGLLTFNVPVRAAQYIATFGQAGGFYLTLVPKDFQPKPIDALPSTMTLLPGEDPAQLCPYFDTVNGDVGCSKAG
jgi:Flp pilus assembly protein CpaB